MRGFLRGQQLALRTTPAGAALPRFGPGPFTALQGKEFIRIGYYVNNEYQEEELRENPPEQPIIDKLCRSILADHPRVTRFPVDFDSTSTDPGMQVSPPQASA